MFVVDTNILVYASDMDSPFHGACKERITEWRAQASVWYLTWGIIYEFLRVVTHPKILRQPFSAVQAWSFIQALLATPSLSLLIPTDRHAAVLAQVLDQVPLLGGNIIHDAHTAVLMREHGIRRIYTRDTDFHRFGFLEPVDPTA
jgi:toxin-antitoxin system PIN domain toxin